MDETVILITGGTGSFGQKITEIRQGELFADRITIIWDGRDSHGNKIPSGVYFAVLKSGQKYRMTKVVSTRK